MIKWWHELGFICLETLIYRALHLNCGILTLELASGLDNYSGVRADLVRMGDASKAWVDETATRGFDPADDDDQCVYAALDDPFADDFQIAQPDDGASDAVARYRASDFSRHSNPDAGFARGSAIDAEIFCQRDTASDATYLKAGMQQHEDTAKRSRSTVQKHDNNDRLSNDLRRLEFEVYLLRHQLQRNNPAPENAGSAGVAAGLRREYDRGSQGIHGNPQAEGTASGGPAGGPQRMGSRSRGALPVTAAGPFGSVGGVGGVLPVSPSAPSSPSVGHGLCGALSTCVSSTTPLGHAQWDREPGPSHSLGLDAADSGGALLLHDPSGCGSFPASAIPIGSQSTRVQSAHGKESLAGFALNTGDVHGDMLRARLHPATSPAASQARVEGREISGSKETFTGRFRVHGEGGERASKKRDILNPSTRS